MLGAPTMWMNTLFTLEGRLRRSEWWLTRLLVLGLFIAFLIVVGVLDATVGIDGGSGEAMLVVLSMAGFAAVLWIDVCAGVKRLHDQDMSGWMYLLVLVPALGALFALIVLGIIDGTPGSNDYGPSTKYPDRSRLAAMLFD